MNPLLSALMAVLLWSSLAALATSIPQVPPFLMTGIGLLLGSLLALPLSRFRLGQLRATRRQLTLGVYGLFGYHAALFFALQTAPQVEANLVNYLWPLLIVLLAPFYIKGMRLTIKLFLAATFGFSGAAIAIASSGLEASGFAIGYLFAFLAAVVWATYSLGTKRYGDLPTATVGVFAFVAGMLALLLHFIIEPIYVPTSSDWIVLVALGAGPLGAAFYFWDYAIKKGNPQQIGLLSFLTPLLSTTALILVTGRQLSLALALAALLIVLGAVLGKTGSSTKSEQ